MSTLHDVGQADGECVRHCRFLKKAFTANDFIVNLNPGGNEYLTS